MTAASVPRALRWRCRRGMRELDALLGAWLDRRWAQVDELLQQAFERLLEQEDDQLWDWLLGRTRPADLNLARIVDDIREHAGPG